MSEPRVASTRVNGIDMAYRRWAAPPEAAHPPVILLHGVLQTGEGMRHLAECLALDGEVIVPDLRGRGDSSRPHSGYDPITMADDVSELIERLGVGPVALVGRLHGGLVAYHLAARRPEQVRGIVLGDATPEVSERRAARIQERVSALPPHFPTRADAERFYEVDLGLSPARTRNDLPSDLVRAEDGTYHWRHDLGIVARIEAAAMPRSDWDVLGRIRCPALILHGQRGEIGPETAARMVETMPSARSLTILGAGHDVFLGPGEEQTLAAIQLFLRGLGQAHQ